MINENFTLLVLINGNIVTVDIDYTVQEAVAIRGDEIISLGSSGDIERNT